MQRGKVVEQGRCHGLRRSHGGYAEYWCDGREAETWSGRGAVRAGNNAQ